jgi:hypothetical protein
VTGKASTKRLVVRWHLAAVCAFLSSAHAAEDDASFKKLIEDPHEQQHVITAAGRSTVFLQNPCADARFAIEKKFVPYQPASFDASGALVSGSWKQSVDEQGCGASRVLNVMVVSQGLGKLAVVPLLPGGTRADPILQQDAVKYAVRALATVPGGREPNCKVGYVADTEFLQEEGQAPPGANARAWKELWTLESCTQKMLIPMRFVPDSTGTSISAGPNTAIRIVPLAK